MISLERGGSKFAFILLVALLVLALALYAPPGGAQTFRGGITGTVADPSGAVVPSAQVVATEIATGLEHKTVTTSDGLFSFLDIPLGSYRVKVTATGFAPYTVDKVEVGAGSPYTLPIRLKVGEQATAIEISAATLTVDTTTQTQNLTIPSDVVQEMPLNGRDFTQLIGVVPGYGGYTGSGFGSLNGTRPNQINWQINGMDNNDFWHNVPAVNQGGVSGIAGIILPIDAVDEFSAQTQSGPEGGRNAGGTVNVVTKAGTNTWHGSAYHYNRNEFYGATTPFFVPSVNNPNPPKVRNLNTGFSLGGPAIKNKLFGFVSYERQEYIIGVQGVATEPSVPWITLSTDVVTNGNCFAAPCSKYGTYVGVTPSPLSATLLGTPAGISSKGFWPASQISNLPATLNNFFAGVPSTGFSNNGVARVDYNISDKHHLYLYFFGGQGNQIAPLGASAALGTASSNLHDYFEVAPIHVYNYSGVLNSSITSHMTNQVVAGVNYFKQVFHDFKNSFDTKALGLFLSPDATISGQPIPGAPNIQISGFEQIGLTPPEGRRDITGQLTDIVSYTMGKHQFRFGGEFRHAVVEEFYHRRGTGRFKFNGLQGPWGGATGCGAAAPTAACLALASPSTTFALADFLAGDVASSTIAVGVPQREVSINAYNLYFQDQWQITPRLNLNFGMRYEYFGPLHDDSKDIANFIPGKGLQIQGATIDDIFPPDRNNFAPRVGFAYQVRDKGDIVIRGGFGVFYDQINMNPFLDFRPPITGAQGIQGNPFGPAPVSTFSRSTYNWDAVQAGGASVFPGVITCADPVCATTSPATPAGTPVPAFNLYSVNRNFRTPYFYNYNVQAEMSFGKWAVAQVGYVGSQGRKLNNVIDINQNGQFAPGSANPTASCTEFTSTVAVPCFGSILQLNSIGTSNYNAFQTSFAIRSWYGLSMQLGYTWSHALDEISEYRAVIQDDAFNRHRDYGNGDYDTRHLFTANVLYAFPKAPWTNNWAKYLLNDWSLASLWNFHSGQSSDETLLGLDLLANPYHLTTHRFFPGVGVQWWNPAAFAVPVSGPLCPNTQTGFCGNLQRNRFRGPGYGDIDFSIIKNIPIYERIKMQLRADMYNLFNRINLSQGVGAVGSSCGAPIQSNPKLAPTLANRTCTTSAGFGLVNDTSGDFFGAPGIGPGEPFNMQLAIKIIF